ncbi:hypothetical protein AVEN_22973-1 [Araneus ventricosus]|uniref:Uncharacterized protein n=1 Tax=Araneus ventricosus TaxID=182803 RepID=A0A4Y2RNQ9_ARAVE|nr:hypothetical protein AVEN_22973-1 [Araneus ventricosus]
MSRGLRSPALWLDFSCSNLKPAIHRYSIPFNLPQDWVFFHPFKSKKQARRSLKAPKCATRRSSIPPLFHRTTRWISDFLTSSRGLNLGRFFDAPPTLASGSQIGIGS